MLDALDIIGQIFENIPNAVFYKDRDLVYRYCNDEFADYIGLPKDKIIGSTVYEVAPKELADLYHTADLDLLEKEGRQVYESFVRKDDGDMRRVIFNKSVIRDRKGDPIGIAGVIQDISESYVDRRKLELLHQVKDALLKIHRELVDYTGTKAFFGSVRHMLNSIFKLAEGLVVYEIDRQGMMFPMVIAGHNRKGLNEAKVPFETSTLFKLIKGEMNRSIVCRGEVDTLYRLVHDPLGIQGEATNALMIIPLRFANKRRFILVLDSSQFNAFGQAEIMAANYIRDELPILYRVFSLHKGMEKITKYDGLTDLYNRRTFERLINNHLDHHRVSKDELILVTIDLIGLKDINSCYGHAGGDEYILTLRDRLKRIEAKDPEHIAVGRLSSDVFVIMFSEYVIDAVESIMEEEKAVFEAEEIRFEDNTFKGAFSYGMAGSEDCESASQLIRAADMALYEKMK